MRRVPVHRGIAVVGAVAILVTSLGAVATAQDAMEPETTEFTLAKSSPGVSTVALLAAAAALNEQGWNIDVPELTAGELQLQGVASGDFQMSSGSGPGALLAAQLGAPVKIIAARIKNEWTLYSKSEFAECADLDGVKLAIHSEGSPATFMTRNFIDQTCPGTQPDYIILPGSENRFAALLADEIDASPLELGDAIALEIEGGDRFLRQASFAAELPDLMLTPIYVNTDFAEANPNTVTAFLAEVISQQRRFYEDPAYFKERTLEIIPAINEATVDDVLQAYLDLEMYAVDGGISEAQQQYSIDFLVDAGRLEPGLTPEQGFDRSYLDAALALLDGE